MNNKNLRFTKSKFTAIDAILSNVMDELGLDRRIQEKSLLSLWSSLLEPVYATRSMPLYIDNQGILIVAVENGSTAQELSFLKAKLLSQLQTIGAGLGISIKGIRFDLKQFAQIADKKNTIEQTNNQLANKPTPSDEELAAFKLDDNETEEIARLKEQLHKTLGETSENSFSNQMLVRIINSVEKRKRFKKWCIQQNMPVCKQCGEPLLAPHQQLNTMLCPLCANM